MELDFISIVSYDFSYGPKSLTDLKYLNCSYYNTTFGSVMLIKKQMKKYRITNIECFFVELSKLGKFCMYFRDIFVIGT